MVVGFGHNYQQFVVNDVLGNPVAWELRDWLAGALVPDEHFYSTLATIQVKNTLILLSLN